MSKAKADYLFTLEHNHKTLCEDVLYENVALWLNSKFHDKLPIIQTIEKDHGGFEVRRYVMFTQLGWLQDLFIFLTKGHA